MLFSSYVGKAAPFERLAVSARSERAWAQPKVSGPGARATDTQPAEPTWHERRIADPVAGGLTETKTGERIFLSPRTVNSHPYRVFPELGITFRAAPAGLEDGHGLWSRASNGNAQSNDSSPEAAG
ncbi:hypothetical protein ACFC8N_26245 [Streptomyces sp. NPDC055966]|uniref:hypothetical protein n=1 Tax=Streptomyces sp. NPDC055966 TaxID=3345669 RepID=UPI0035D9AC0A